MEGKNYKKTHGKKDLQNEKFTIKKINRSKKLKEKFTIKKINRSKKLKENPRKKRFKEVKNYNKKRFIEVNNYKKTHRKKIYRSK